MFKWLQQGWRICATALCFFCFGVGGIVLSLLVFPSLYGLIWRRHLRTLCARCVIRLAFRGLIELMRALGLLCYDIRGLERLERKGLLILANHPTLIDTVFLMAFAPRADGIVKSALWRNPFTRAAVCAAGYIRNSNGPGLVDDCVASLRLSNNLIIFPEGTRTPRSGNIRLKRGAATVAVRSKNNITPVIIHCTPPALGKGEKWWRVPPGVIHFTVDVKEDIEVQPFIEAAGNDLLAARQLTLYLLNYFTQEQQSHAAA